MRVRMGFAIPRYPGVRYVVDFGGPRPYPAYLHEHAPDYGTYQGGRARKSQEDFAAVPGFENGTEILRESAATREREVAHEDAAGSASSSSRVRYSMTPARRTSVPWSGGCATSELESITPGRWSRPRPG